MEKTTIMINNNTIILPVNDKCLHLNQGANKHKYSCWEVQLFPYLLTMFVPYTQSF